MATEPPLWLNPTNYAPPQVRRADAIMLMTTGSGLGGRAGVRPGTGGFFVTLSGSTISIAAGVASVYVSGQGIFRVVLTSTATKTLTAADITYGRVDLVYLRVWDSDIDGLGLYQGDVVYLAGTPSATPAVPTPGAGEMYIQLGQITVPVSGGPTPTVADVRPITVAPGGILPVQSADLATAGLYPGQVRYNAARGLLEYWSGTAWRADGDYQDWPLALGASTSNPTGLSSSGRYTQIGGHVEGDFAVKFGSSTGSGTYLVSSLPVPGRRVMDNVELVIGQVQLTISGNNYNGSLIIISGTGSFSSAGRIRLSTGSTSSAWTSTSPAAPVSGSWITGQYSYEAA